MQSFLIIFMIIPIIFTPMLNFVQPLSTGDTIQNVCRVFQTPNNFTRSCSIPGSSHVDHVPFCKLANFYALEYIVLSVECSSPQMLPGEIPTHLSNICPSITPVLQFLSSQVPTPTKLYWRLLDLVLPPSFVPLCTSKIGLVYNNWSHCLICPTRTLEIP